jgi:hypothetical protein
MKRIAILAVLLATSISASIPTPWIHVNGGAWDPDELVLLTLSAGIRSYVASEATRQNANLSDWGKYRFQYQGQMEGKRRVVLVNAFCYSFGDERLESEFFLVNDGGPCFFTLVYDPGAHEFHSLRFNGYA